MFRAKSANVEISESDKQKEIKELTFEDNPANYNGDIIHIYQGIIVMITRLAQARPNLGIPNILNLSGVLPVCPRHKRGDCSA